MEVPISYCIKVQNTEKYIVTGKHNNNLRCKCKTSHQPLFKVRLIHASSYWEIFKFSSFSNHFFTALEFREAAYLRKTEALGHLITMERNLNISVR